ncbi:MAG: peptide-methionine (S)-S-oxide reductase [Hyphomonadaceae bacterium]|nr:MAG: peptide-methionine (S)-S-oxide reductase [Hyphomonadaceae bacterium]KAF0187095.1 MAG: peptide-methionine (S)-S-oxide reductase [Hyphomonadaceae bacterium]
MNSRMFQKLLSAIIFAFATLGIFSATSAQNSASQIRTAVFAGGCFWCMEKPFDHVVGVISTISGFSGGHLANPSYEAVSAGGTGHYEVIQVRYDASKVTYAQLLGTYWQQIDPFDGDGQFCDRGDTYRPAIFVANATERAQAIASKQALATQFGRPIRVEVLDAAQFYPAETYHQDYYRKNPVRYNFYRNSCGRDARLEQVWGRGH